MDVTPVLCHKPSLLFILLLTIYLFPFSSSANTTSAPAGIVVKLLHLDAHMNLTYQQHVHAGIHRTHHRAAHHAQGRPHPQAATLETPIQGYNGEYLMKLAIGTPPTSFTAAMDTGSTLTWALCFHSENKTDRPIFDPESSSSYSKVPCSNPICQIDNVLSGCNATDCAYMAQYADSSASMGVLSWETLTLGSMTVKNFGFGCSFEADGFGYGAAIVGFNRGNLSLISQLGPLIDHQFSYCLGGYDASNHSRLTIGPSSHSILSNASASTKLLVNPANPGHYYVSFHGISVAGKRLPINESAFQFDVYGSGGVIVDSGSTFTGLGDEAYSLLREAFIKEIGKPTLNSTFLDIDTCFQGFPNSLSIPTLTLHFEGANLQVPEENYIIIDTEKQLSCLAILPTPAPVTIIGARTLQNFHINYDLGRNMITFTPAQCSTL